MGRLRFTDLLIIKNQAANINQQPGKNEINIFPLLGFKDLSRLNKITIGVVQISHVHTRRQSGCIP